MTANPIVTIPPAVNDPACHDASTTRPAATTTAVATCNQSMRNLHGATIGWTPPRNNSSGLTRRTSSSGTNANSSETSRPTATPWTTADAVRPYTDAPNEAATDAGIERIANHASATPTRLPASPSSVT
jgi:hypothetical protein